MVKGSAGVAILLFLAGGAIVVMAARGTYYDVWHALANAASAGSETGKGVQEPPGGSGESGSGVQEPPAGSGSGPRSGGGALTNGGNIVSWLIGL